MTVYEQGQAFGGVIDVLEAGEARYAIWGGVAVVAYGEAFIFVSHSSSRIVS